ncbi:hypothetical protein [Yersinia phage vB_YenS-P840]|nr:hypothetical protein [Yersinia phage vB_YenS-P840]
MGCYMIYYDCMGYFIWLVFCGYRWCLFYLF